VNIACGSSVNRNKHIKVIRATIETMIANKEPEKFIDNWRYAEIVLPRMFAEYQSRKNREAQRQIMTRN
jgi:hypothetical protein